jgi:hypothetical protein
VEEAKRSKQLRREASAASHGDFRRSLYEVTINSMVKPQSRGENSQNRAFWLFRAYLRLFDFYSASKKIGVFWCLQFRLCTIQLVSVCCRISREKGLF